MKNSSNIKKYRRLAPFYDLVMDNRVFFKARERAFQLLPMEPNQKVLLVGIGTGEDLRFLPADVQIVGIDLSEEMLSRARKKAPYPSVELLQMNAEELHFADSSFDLVVLNLILSVVENPRLALSEALRVLKKDGRILVFDKFLQPDQQPTLLRQLFNLFTSTLGTNINRRFDEIAKGLPLQIILDEPSIFSGIYRHMIIKKRDLLADNQHSA